MSFSRCTVFIKLPVTLFNPHEKGLKLKKERERKFLLAGLPLERACSKGKGWMNARRTLQRHPISLPPPPAPHGRQVFTDSRPAVRAPPPLSHPLPLAFFFLLFSDESLVSNRFQVTSSNPLSAVGGINCNLARRSAGSSPRLLRAVISMEREQFSFFVFFLFFLITAQSLWLPFVL